jgi:hypothetical protein
MNDPAAKQKTNRVKSNQPPPPPQPQPLRTIVVPISALRPHPEQPLPSQWDQSALAPSFGIEMYVIPGSNHKHGYQHEWGRLQWAAYVIAMYCPQEFRAQRIANKSAFTTKVTKLLKKEPKYLARFRKFPSRRTVMRAWKLARARNDMDSPKAG